MEGKREEQVCPAGGTHKALLQRAKLVQVGWVGTLVHSICMHMIVMELFRVAVRLILRRRA